MIDVPLLNALFEVDTDADRRRALRVAYDLDRARDRRWYPGRPEVLYELQALWRRDCTRRAQEGVLRDLESAARVVRLLGERPGVCGAEGARSLEELARYLRAVAAEPSWVDEPWGEPS